MNKLSLSGGGPNVAATNSSGFAGIPAGYCNEIGAFYGFHGLGQWWSSSVASTNFVWAWDVFFDNGNATRSAISTGSGVSVRCLRD